MKDSGQVAMKVGIVGGRREKNAEQNNTQATALSLRGETVSWCLAEKNFL